MGMVYTADWKCHSPLCVLPLCAASQYISERERAQKIHITSYLVWITYAQTHSLAANTQYAFCYTFYCVCDMRPVHHPSVFFVCYSYSMLFQLLFLPLLRIYVNLPPFLRVPEKVFFYSFCDRRLHKLWFVCSHLFSIKSFSLGSDDWDEIWWRRAVGGDGDTPLPFARWKTNLTSENWISVRNCFEASSTQWFFFFLLNQISCFERKSFFFPFFWFPIDTDARSDGKQNKVAVNLVSEER